MKEREREILRHSLGLNRSDTEYRNYFVTGQESDDFPICAELTRRGLMTDHGSNLATGGMTCFRVTDAGRRALRSRPRKIENEIDAALPWVTETVLMIYFIERYADIYLCFHSTGELDWLCYMPIVE